MNVKQKNIFVYHRSLFILWLLATLLPWFSATEVTAEQLIRIAYNLPWSAGSETLKVMNQNIPSKQYNINTQHSQGDLVSPLTELISRKVDVAIIRHEILFQGVKNKYPALAVANAGRYTVVFNKDEFSNMEKILTEFLKDWQNAWSSTDFPYGLQPPDVKYLSEHFRKFLEETGENKNKIEPLMNSLSKHIDVLIDSRSIEMNQKKAEKALEMMREYYATTGAEIIEASNAKKGETYVGRIKQEYSKFIEVDIKPCKDFLVNIEEPYDQKNTNSKKHCEGRDWDIVEVTKR